MHERHDIAQEIASLKAVCPAVRVIAISENPSPHDAPIIEQGVFYYLTLPIGQELTRVIEAGAGAFSGSAPRPKAVRGEP